MGLTLKQARQLAGLTQKEVAEVLGVHTHTYMKWERNPEEMSVGTAKQFSRIVKVEVNEIFFEDQSNLIRQNGGEQYVG
ncbi:DNA-binding XRE family transcriptional regulator [Paenibacillus cellulosilyticus]|uniref:DNA-binding XRE family transcriptional regulator n=1 Tax=Paenibacillus cellulosilyticus TaxID=375489 RepID=A0A2V2YXX6_9BACL|nr:helix-turn-helix transcriptional regulator [Paenibacillus cellulosilyticus]PWV97473.1 DNA-binding XRE family transcriptional regulator [Paenibacillus cellulosilyticus]QKS48490.1 helix-turn-helix transcriptional regulator [Paenibacillus cellulosilyticus]